MAYMNLNEAKTHLFLHPEIILLFPYTSLSVVFTEMLCELILLSLMLVNGNKILLITGSH